MDFDDEQQRGQGLGSGEAVPPADWTGFGGASGMEALYAEHRGELKGLHELATMRQQPMLHVDARQRRRQLAQIAGGRAHEAAKLPKGPVGRRHRIAAIGEKEAQTLGIVARGLDPDCAGLDRTGGSDIGARSHRLIKLTQRKIALIIGAGEPFR